jgi:vitamin B12 transporter
MYKILIVFVFVCIFQNLQSQNIAKDTIRIEEVEIFASRLNNFSIGGNIQKINKITLEKFENQNISELLSKQTSVIINSYGIGGVSSPTMRGGGSSHTAVIWNGMNLQSPLTGIVNLALMPTYLFDNIDIQYGGSGTIYGSGNISGAIHLNNESLLNSKETFSSFVSYGSFNNKIVGFSSKIGNEKIANSIKIFSQIADNDFDFNNTSKINSPKMKQTNAESNQFGICNDTELKISKNSNLKLSVWYQNYDKNLQTLMSDSDTSKANQKDKNARILLNFKTSTRKTTTNLKSGLLYDDLFYVNPKYNVQSKISSYSYINEIENKLFISDKQMLNSSINFTHEIGNSNGLAKIETRNRLSVFSNYKLKLLKNKLVSVASFRAEMVDNKIIPLVYNLGSEYNLKFIILKASFAKNYRLPTFNELYWKDGFASGNMNLKPESGISGNFTIEKQISKNDFNFKLNATTFYSKINNWILWTNNAGNYSPQNIKTGINKGFELLGETTLKQGNSSFYLSGNYSFIDSKAEENSKNNQVLYVPKQKINATISYSFKKISICLNHNYFSERFYDYSHFLEAYFIEDLIVGFEHKMKENTVSISLKIANFTNTKYQVMTNYAMPLRNYLITIKYKFN